MKSKSEGAAGWTLTIRRLPPAGFEREQWLIGVGWTLTIRQLPLAGFESEKWLIYVGWNLTIRQLPLGATRGRISRCCD